MVRNFTTMKVLYLIAAVLMAPLILGTSCQVLPTGSCCVNGTCTVTTQAACGGTWTSGGVCTPNPCSVIPTVTTLLDQEIASTAGGGFGVVICPAVTGGFFVEFTPTNGKTVTVTVTGPTTASHPQIDVVTGLFTIPSEVANSGVSPTTQTTTVTFIATATASHFAAVNECAIVFTPGLVYHIVVTQQ